MRAECCSFSENLLSKLRIYFAISYSIANKLAFQKFLKSVIEYLLDDNLFLMWDHLFSKLVLLTYCYLLVIQLLEISVNLSEMSFGMSFEAVLYYFQEVP